MFIVKTGSSPYIKSSRIGIGAFLLLKSTSGKNFSSIFPKAYFFRTNAIAVCLISAEAHIMRT